MKFWLGSLVILGLCVLIIASNGFAQFFGLLCVFLIMPAIGSLFSETGHLTSESRRYRTIAIWGIIFFLGWGIATFLE